MNRKLAEIERQRKAAQQQLSQIVQTSDAKPSVRGKTLIRKIESQDLKKLKLAIAAS